MVAGATSLLLSTLLIAGLHALMPTHWLPFILVGRAQRWSRRKTVAITALAGSGHVISTTLLGLLVAGIGLGVLKVAESVAVPVASGLLISLGIGYLALHFKRSGHSHHQQKRVNISDRSAVLSLLAILTLSPCEATLPLFFAAGYLGWRLLLPLSLTNAVATVACMVLVTYLGFSGMERLRFQKLERNEKLIVGVVFVLLGVAMMRFH